MEALISLSETFRPWGVHALLYKKLKNGQDCRSITAVCGRRKDLQRDHYTLAGTSAHVFWSSAD